MYEFTEIKYELLDEEEFNRYSRKPIFTTKQWIDYIIEDSGAKPLVLRIVKSGNFKGYITFLITKKFGIKIAGSPFRGWSTCWMGIEVEDIQEKPTILIEVIQILFKRYHCLYCEIVDRDIEEIQIKKLEYDYSLFDTLELNINKSDEELWKVFKTDCRNFIKQFERRGASLEVVDPSDRFAEEYYRELQDVFAKQNMTPTYTCEKVKCLLKHIDKKDILCLRVISPLGEPVASSIFFADKNRFYFWGGASYREHQHYRPNEYMIWYAIKYWREKGIEKFDMVGDRKYKQKFGAEPTTYLYIKIARYKSLIKCRDIAEKIYFFNLKFKRKIKLRLNT